MKNSSERLRINFYNFLLQTFSKDFFLTLLNRNYFRIIGSCQEALRSQLLRKDSNEIGIHFIPWKSKNLFNAELLL